MLDLFITGADQSSGKIFVTAGLTATMQSLGYSTGVYKPVEAGAVKINGFVQSHDLAFIKFVDPYIKTYYSYLLKERYTPLLAAAAEHMVIDKDVILKDFQKIQDVNECLVVDGVSGLATPFGKNFLEEDMIKMLDLPLLMVVCACSPVNSVLLSLNHAKEKELNFRGVILSNYPDNTVNANIRMMPRLIEEYTDIKVLGILPVFEKNLNPNDLITEVLNGVDIEAVFEVRIAKLQL